MDGTVINSLFDVQIAHLQPNVNPTDKKLVYDLLAAPRKLRYGAS